jgi:hypothetical protein
VLQLLFTRKTRRDGKSKNSLDWPSKRQFQTAKFLQFLRKVDKRLTSQSKKPLNTHSGCRSGEQNVHQNAMIGTMQAHSLAIHNKFNHTISCFDDLPFSRFFLIRRQLAHISKFKKIG